MYTYFFKFHQKTKQQNNIFFLVRFFLPKKQKTLSHNLNSSPQKEGSFNMPVCTECKTTKPDAGRTICTKCFNKRSKCASSNCTRKVDAKGIHKYCKACSCTNYGCQNKKDSGATVCESCFDNAEYCYICNENKVTGTFKTCSECNAARPKCSVCDKKAKFDSETDAYFKYCSDHICRQPNCGNQNTDVQRGFLYCDACSKCLCVVCEKTIAQLGKDVCRNCPPKCMNAAEQCQARVQYHFEKQKVGDKTYSRKVYHRYCRNCSCKNSKCDKLKGNNSDLCSTCTPCAAENCLQSVSSLKGNFDYCATCNYQWKQNKLKCIFPLCQEYTTNESKMCDECRVISPILENE